MDSRPRNRTPRVRCDDPSRWLGIVSHEQRGLVPAAARAGLTVLAGLYRAGLAAWNLRWRLPGAVRLAPCPVVSVGNLTVGGTGKTPMVAYLADLLVSEGYRPLIVSRGYGAQAGAMNEEARELADRCPTVPHVQNPDRLQAIRDWTASQGCDVAILDDGFQHRRLARDLDVVLLDGLRPFGYGHVLPRGLLREPPSALRRADVVIITRADLLGADALARVKEAAARCASPGTPVLTAVHRPAGIVFADGSRGSADWLDGQAIAAACGIANPEAFRRTLERLGARVVRLDAFRDHHAYTADDLAGLAEAARDAGAGALVTTGKDFVKWRPVLAERPAALPVTAAALEVAMHLTDGEDRLRQRVLALLPEPRPRGDR